MSTSGLTARRMRLLRTLYGLAAIWGVRVVLLPPGRRLSDLFLGVVTALAVTLLVAADAEVAGKPLPRESLWVVFFLWPLAAPVCIVATRRLAGLKFVLVHGTGSILVFVVVGLAALWLVG